MESNICEFCGEPLRMIIQSNYVICPICERKSCLKCQKLGLCPDHYKEIPESTKSEIKEIRRKTVLFIILVSILLFASLASFEFINRDKNFIEMNPYDTEKYLYLLFVILFLPIFFGIISHYNKKIKKILYYSIEIWKQNNSKQKRFEIDQ
ncbi:hypothetical protein [Candidatus Harpocratesius sp.]